MGTIFGNSGFNTGGLKGAKSIFKITVIASPLVTREPGEFLIVKAFAEITVRGVPQTVSTRGMDHIPATASDFNLSSVGAEELDELKGILFELGFVRNEIEAATQHATKEGLVRKA